MKFSIIINTHNQEKFIYKSINSCLKQKFSDYEILVFDTSDKKLNYKFRKFIKRKKIKYFHSKIKFTQPEKNQMYKIYRGLKKSKGEFLCLLDGDDYFSLQKLKKLNGLLNRKKISFNQDKPILVRTNLKKKEITKNKNYKNNPFFKIFFNEWPQIYGTSSILIKRKILKNFFYRAKPFKWKYLAIDVQLAIFCYLNFNIGNYEEKITYKNLHQNNLGDNYLNLLKKIFWLRRYMQHKYFFFIKKETIFNFDYVLTSIIYFFLKNL